MSKAFNIRFKYVVACYRTCASASEEISETESACKDLQDQATTG
jgi:hypothetical protein